jgi:carboxyl-terminal processing protease
MRGPVLRPRLSRRLRCGLAGLTALLSLSAVPGACREAMTEQVFRVALTRIAEIYLEPVALEQLTRDGLKGLGRIDPQLSVEIEGGIARLRRGDALLLEIATPRDDAPARWASVITRLLERARGASAAIRAAEPEEINRALFEAMLADLDPYSRYSGGDKAVDERSQREGYGGVGMTLRSDGPQMLVADVLPHSPAGAAGIKAGDALLAIDGQPLGDLSADQVASRLKGPAGSTVDVTLLIGGSMADGLSRRLSLRRDRVVPNTVSAHIDGTVGVLKVDRFNAATALNLREAIQKLRGELKWRASGFVLDLRGNPGGLLDQAVAVADEFMTSGRIVSTVGRHPDSVQRFDATPDDQLDGLPLVVLVDARTASSAEIVAAALEDSGRAVLVGSSSFGKGSVQTVTRLPNDGELFLTWSRIHAPSGYTLHGQGVRPTVCLGAHPGDVRHILNGGKGPDRATIALWRAKAPDDAVALNQIRDSCPWVDHPAELDVEVAKAILNDGHLYRQGLQSAETTVAEHR